MSEEIVTSPTKNLSLTPTKSLAESQNLKTIIEKIEEKPAPKSGVLSCANCSRKANLPIDSRPIVIIEACGSLITPWGLLPKGYKKNKNFSKLLPKNESDDKSLNWFSWMQLFQRNLDKELKTLGSRLTYAI